MRTAAKLKTFARASPRAEGADVPPEAAPPRREGPSALLDQILAMILLRLPKREGVTVEAHTGWQVRKHEAVVANWRDEVGCLPRATDALNPDDLDAQGMGP